MEIKTTKEIMLTYNDNKTLEYKWVRVEDIVKTLRKIQKGNAQNADISILCNKLSKSSNHIHKVDIAHMVCGYG